MDEKSPVIMPDAFKTGTPKKREMARNQESIHKPKYIVAGESIDGENNNDNAAARYITRKIKKDFNSKEVQEGENMSGLDENQFEKRIENKLNHQNEMNIQRYENLSSSLGIQITNAIDKLETSQNNYFEKSDLKTEKLLSDFREEMRVERKKDRNTITTRILTGVGIIVAIAGVIIPMVV